MNVYKINYYNTLNHHGINITSCEFISDTIEELKEKFPTGRIVSELIDDNKQKDRMISIFDKLNFLINDFSNKIIVKNNEKINIDIKHSKILLLNITDKLGEIIYQQIPAQNFGYIKQGSIIYIDIDFDFSKTKLLDDLKNYIIKENRNIKLTNILN